MGSDKFFSIFGKITLALIFLGIVGFAGYYLGTNNEKKPLAVTPTPVREDTAASPTVVLTAVQTPATAADETVTLKTAVKQALVAKNGKDAESLTITVSKIEGNYAKGMANAQGGGGIWFAAKVNGVWKLVWDGNGIIKCADLLLYPEFPADLIPQCFNDKTQQLEKR